MIHRFESFLQSAKTDGKFRGVEPTAIAEQSAGLKTLTSADIRQRFREVSIEEEADAEHSLNNQPDGKFCELHEFVAVI